MVRDEIKVTIKGVDTRVLPLGFGVEKNAVRIAPHPPMQEARVNTSLDLNDCFVGWVGKDPLIRSGIIDTEHKAAQLLAVAAMVDEKRKNRKGLALCSNQLNAIETDWERAEQQHQRLLASEQTLDPAATIIHCAASLDHFFFPSPPRQMALAERKTLMELPRLLNMEAWRVYCARYNALLQQRFAQVDYDAVDAYTIERHIMEFHHEVHNHYLDNTIKRLRQLQLTLGKHENSSGLSYRQLVKIEKEIIILRQDLKRMVHAHYDHLAEIVHIIPIIERAHEELAPIKNIGKLLKESLAYDLGLNDEEASPFAKKQILAQLLSGELGMVSAINSDTGQDRTQIVFALRLAILQLKESTSKEDAIELALNWTEKMRQVHDAIGKMNAEECAEWLAKQSHFKSLTLFWELFTENLIQICQPIIRWNRRASDESFTKKFLNREYLSILPPFKINGSGCLTMLLEYDKDTCMPKDLTNEGYQFLLQNSLL